jgi:single-strand DNA-binding protein
MLNVLTIVGRLVSDPTNDKITLAVPRNYKNSEGEYETDFIDVRIWGGMVQNVTEYCKKGDIVGVKGRLESTTEDDGDGHFIRRGMIVVAEKVTFLSSRHDVEMQNA